MMRWLLVEGRWGGAEKEVPKGWGRVCGEECRMLG